MFGFCKKKKLNEMRLSDRVLFALDLALTQKDVELSDVLSNALEMSLTRSAGGSRFSERRDYPDDVQEAFKRLHDLKGK